MSETAVEIAVCASCGADVRDESVFCYNCGKPVVGEAKITEAAPREREVVRTPGSRPPLRTAASLRKERRASNRQPVEVSWEQRTGSPVAFVITTIVLVIGALVLLFLALYLR